MCDAFELANKIQISRIKSIGAHFVYLTCHIHTKGRWKSHLIDKKVTFSTTSECEPLSEWNVCFFAQNSASQKKSPCFYLHFQSIHRTDSKIAEKYNAIFWNSNQLYNSVTPYFASIFRYIRYMHCTIHTYMELFWWFIRHSMFFTFFKINTIHRNCREFILREPAKWKRRR